MKNKGRSFLSVLFGLLFFLFLRVDSWLCSLPAWLTLILHFTVGLSIWWFWGTLIVWIAVGILRYLLILFGRWGASGEEPFKENKNPYSAKDPFYSSGTENKRPANDEKNRMNNAKDVFPDDSNEKDPPGEDLH